MFFNIGKWCQTCSPMSCVSLPLVPIYGPSCPRSVIISPRLCLITPHLFQFSSCDSSVFLSLSFSRPILFMSCVCLPLYSMSCFNNGILNALLVSSLLALTGSWQNIGPKILKVSRTFSILRGDRVRRSHPRPYPARSHLLRVCRGILQACRRDSAGRRDHPPTVPARDLLPPPHGSPKHHRIMLERGDLPVSGKFPGPSRNQPAAPLCLPASPLSRQPAALSERTRESALPERPRESALPERPRKSTPVPAPRQRPPVPAPRMRPPVPAPRQHTQETPELTESTPEPAPVQELTESTPELAPFQELTESTPEPAPFRGLSGGSPGPLQSPLHSRNSQSRFQSAP